MTVIIGTNDDGDGAQADNQTARPQASRHAVGSGFPRPTREVDARDQFIDAASQSLAQGQLALEFQQHSLAIAFAGKLDFLCQFDPFGGQRDWLD